MLNFTRQERKITLFLTIMALLGAGINYFSKANCPLRPLVSFDPRLGKIDLNKSDKSALMSVPGLGEKIAARILDYRKENNGFQSVDELKNIKGVTAYRYGKFKDLFYAD